MRVTNVVIATNVLLIAVKIAVALLTGSIAVLATLVDSLFDLLGALFAWFGVRAAAKPADSDHLYGHKKIENLASLAQVTLIALAAFGIIAEAGRRFATGVAIEVAPLDLLLILFAVGVDVALAAYLRKKNRELHSSAIEAAAGNYYSDVFQNSAALIGLGLASAGFVWADPVAAVLLSLLMLRVAYRVGRHSANELLDPSPEPAKIADIQEAILHSPGVNGFHKLRAKKHEEDVFIDVDVQMNGALSLQKAHAFTHGIKARLAKLGVKEAVIHLEPPESPPTRKKRRNKLGS